MTNCVAISTDFEGLAALVHRCGNKNFTPIVLFEYSSMLFFYINYHLTYNDNKKEALTYYIEFFNNYVHNTFI